MIDISPEHKHIVQNILCEYVPQATVYVFGSRASLTAKPHSDLDLVIIDKSEIPINHLHLLQEAFAESDLPFRVDVLDWHALSDTFRGHIQKCWQKL